ncbi:MAG: amidohydrolase family protein [Acidimicrobiales bacterium]
MKSTSSTDRGTIFVGGTIHPMGSAKTPIESVRVDGDRISYVGSIAEAQALGECELVDLDGRSLLPGFVDAHTHPLMHGQCMSWADLSTAASVDEVVKLLREHAQLGPSTGAIRGFGYDQHRLSNGEHPSATDLDRVAPDQEVTILHASGHGYVANSSALANAGITAATPTPMGGLIDRDDDGHPMGRVFDSACDLLTGEGGVEISNHGPNFHLPDSPEQLDARLDEAQEMFLAAGITAVGDAQVTEREMSNYLRARDTGRLLIRVTMYVLSSHRDALQRLGISSTLGDEWLRFGGVKHYADGSLISGTALLPCGCGNTHGYNYHDDGELEDLLADSSAQGLQTATHAQGPDAIQMVLDGLSRNPRPELRHRIEHCGFPTDTQIETMRDLGIVPVPQPTQVFRYGDGVRRDHPELADRMYPSGLYERAGIPVVLSSDAPVTMPDVALACWAAETRMLASGVVLGEDARVSRTTAFAGYTSGGAYALRRSDVGSLDAGKLADLCILDTDPLAVDQAALPDVKVDTTWVGGRLAWSRDGGLARNDR